MSLAYTNEIMKNSVQCTNWCFPVGITVHWNMT